MRTGQLLHAALGGTPTDTKLPTTSPTSGSTVSGQVTVNVDATYYVGVAKVEFWVNGSLICTDTSPAYSCTWKVTGKPNATYTLTAKAYDAAGNNAFVSITVKSSK